MKKLAILFSLLLIVFMGVWVYKAKTPVDRPDDAAAQTKKPWWENNAIPQADPQWVLDPEIPANYIPVPGEYELYMVINDDGLITGYRHRERQEDNSWLWSDVNPDIPDNYEPVSNLDNVYKVVDENGATSYFRYIRNEDDTFAFVPCDKNGQDIVEENTQEDSVDENAYRDTSVIPDNYVHISANIYAVYNEHGVCIGYKERKYDEASGIYYWVDADKPEESSSTNGSLWVSIPAPTIEYSPIVPGNPQGDTIIFYPDNSYYPGYNDESSGGNAPGINGDNSYTPPVNGSNIPNSSTDGVYTETETLTEKKTSGGWVVTYQTVITRVYSSDGTLVSTSKDGPTEIGREKITGDTGGVPDPALIASTLSEEYARVSTGLAYTPSVANEVLAIINTERVAAGLPALSLNTSSTTQLLADTRAADMAIYSHSDHDSPMYGTITEMCTRFGVSYGSVSEYVWRCSSGNTAAEIASRLQLMGSDDFSSSLYSSIGISVVSKGGYYHVDVVLIG